MKKLSLTEWAAIGEIIGTVGIVVSLVFLAYSIDRNNEILQATNDNYMYGLLDDTYGEVVRNPDLASMRVKRLNDEKLTDVELQRYNFFLWKQFNIWELGFDRHSDGFLSDEKWMSWNNSFRADLTSKRLGLPKAVWEASRGTYGADFAKHVDAVYARR